MRRPQNIAHRGGAGLWPENTMHAFRQAKAMGVDGFELDIHITRDGEIAVFHDEALKPDIVRDASGAWVARKDLLLKDMTFAELQAYDVGRLKPGTKYAAEHPEQIAADGERIPHLRDVIRLVKGTPLKLWIELKSNFTQAGRTAAPDVFAEKTIALLKAEDALDNAVVIGFDWRPLIAAKRLTPSVPIWCTTLPQSWFGETPPPPAHWPPPPAELAQLRALDAGAAPWTGGFDKARYGGLQGAVKAAGAEGWFPYHPDLTPETHARSMSLGLKTAAWTVNARDDLQRLMGLGVSAICTDYPDRLKALLPP
jgi:glycerophosphoryl diester phosphodiesterase